MDRSINLDETPIIVTQIDLTNYKFIQELSNFPTPVLGVIQLVTDTTYIITKKVDLLGNRLNASGIVALVGESPELSKLFSTGLSVSESLLTARDTIALNNISFEHVKIISLDATAATDAVLDWYGVNFINATTEVGTITGYDNCIWSTIGFLNSGNLTFDGTVGTIGINNTIFNNASGLTSIILPSSLTVTRRFRIDNSAFVSLAGETALNVSASATIPNEGYILNNVNFSGGGTFLTGVQSTDNKARFEGCRGIDNSGNIAQYYMQGNATDTIITTSGVFVKVAGTTTTGAYVEKFDVTTTDNKAVYDGSLTGFYKVTAVASMRGGNNKVLSLAIAKNGTKTVSSETKSTSNGTGRSEAIMCQDIVSLVTTDFIEIFVANNSGTQNITVEDLNVTVERLN